MRLWYLGSGSFAAQCLEELVRHLVPERVLTGLPARGGRGLKELPTRTEEKALALGLAPARTGPLSQNEPLLEALRQNPPDALLVVDFALMVKEPFLSTPRFGCLNIHPSLLPRWRGAAPIPRALMEGDEKTGVTVFRLEPKLDAGPILGQEEIPIALEDGASGLQKRLAALGTRLAVRKLEELESGRGSFEPQDEAPATYAAKLAKAEGELCPDGDARVLHNIVRGLDAGFGAFLMVRGRRLKLWRTLPVEKPQDRSAGEVWFEGDSLCLACGTGALRLDEVQAEGKKRASGADWARGLRLKNGDSLA